MKYYNVPEGLEDYYKRKVTAFSLSQHEGSRIDAIAASLGCSRSMAVRLAVAVYWTVIQGTLTEQQLANCQIGDDEWAAAKELLSKVGVRGE